MDNNDREKYRAEARRKIEEAKRRQAAEKSGKANSRRRQGLSQGSDKRPTSNRPSANAVRSPGNTSTSRDSGVGSGIQGWEGLNPNNRPNRESSGSPSGVRSGRPNAPKNKSNDNQKSKSPKLKPKRVNPDGSRQSGHQQHGTRSNTAGPSRDSRRSAQAETRSDKRREVQPRRAALVNDEQPRTPREKAELNARLRKIQRRRDRSRAIMLSVLVVLVLTVTATLIYLLLNQVDRNVNLQFIYEESLIESYPSTALIVRDEIQVTTSTGGTISPLVADGYYASVGQNMAMVIGDDMNATLVELENFRRQISDVQLEIIAEGQVSGAAAVYSEADGRFRPLINELRRSTVDGRFDTVPAHVGEIDLIIRERNASLAEVLSDNAILDALKAEEAVLQQRLAVNSQTISATQAGLISFSSDGLEDELSISRLSSIHYDDVASYINEGNHISRLPNTVVSGQAVLRQIVSVDQYFTMTVDDISYGHFTDRSTVDIYLPDENLRINGVEVVRAEPRVGSVFLVLRTDQELARLLDQRVAAVNIITNEVNGLKVPRSALKSDDELSGTVKLTVVQNGSYRVIDVDVIASDASFAIVESEDESVVLRQGSLIVLNPDAVVEGTMVND